MWGGCWASVAGRDVHPDAERFVEEVRGDDPEMAAKPRIEERELDGPPLYIAGDSIATRMGSPARRRKPLAAKSQPR
jgi:hypothetical protein